MILDLHRQGLSVSDIARRAGLDRKTVRKYIARGLEPPAYKPRKRRALLIDGFAPYLRGRLASYPELSGRRLWREVRELGFKGGYTSVTGFLHDIRPARAPVFERRFETPAGRQAQVDFAQFRTEFADDPGQMRIVWLFSMVLGHSRLIWGRFVAHQDLQTVLRCHVAAFEALGGVPSEVLYDRMRTAVVGEDAEGVVVFNKSLVELGRHYGFLPKACRPYRAKTKGKVERPFRYIREDFFLARSFRDLDDLNAQFRQWLDQVANARTHATTRRVVSEHFADERPHLQPLPARPVPGGAAAGPADHPRGHGLGGRQPVFGAGPDAQARGRGAGARRRGAHLRGRRADRRPSRAGGQRPAADRSRAPPPAAAGQQRDAAVGGCVHAAQRPPG